MNHEILMQPKVFIDYQGAFLHYGNKWAKFNHVRNNFITVHWCIPLTNVRQLTDNDDENQRTPVQSNKSEYISWIWTLEIIYQSWDVDVFSLSIVKESTTNDYKY